MVGDRTPIERSVESKARAPTTGMDEGTNNAVLEALLVSLDAHAYFPQGFLPMPWHDRMAEDTRSTMTRENDGKFRLMFERSADAILLLDTNTNMFVEYNQATLDMLRCTREELSALHPSALSPPTQPDRRESFEKANEMIATALRNGNHRFEWVHRSPHRDDFPVEVLLTPLSLRQDPVMLVVWRDITDRKRSEEALRQFQKLESVGLLAGGIAHDFNNLLTVISAHLELARIRISDENAVARHLDAVEDALRKAADLTRQMLAYSGRGPASVEVFDLGRLVREMMQLLRMSVSMRITIACEAPGSNSTVELDRAQTEQVIMNLISNAVEAIGDADGTIAVRVRRNSLDAETLARDFAGQNVSPGEKITLEVEDTGQGMSPEVVARIFDPFFSTKRAGRGLGLSAVLGILNAQAAGIHVQSRVGVGTTFQIVFPASRATVAEPPRVNETPRCGVGEVLLVDDEEIVRSSLAGILESLGFTVIQAADGQEAIEVFYANRARIVAVLMDLTMPRMDGYTAFLKLREIDPSVKVILSSGWSETAVAECFAACPPSAVILKPFTREQLKATFDRLGLMTAVADLPSYSG